MSKSRAMTAAEKLFRQQDKAAALTEHEQSRQEALKKTERLRALRLVKEAEEQKAKDAAKAKKAAAKGTAGKATPKS